jgi:hypothetical protein
LKRITQCRAWRIAAPLAGGLALVLAGVVPASSTSGALPAGAARRNLSHSATSVNSTACGTAMSRNVQSPPAGFDPLTASTALLREYGLPAPPPTSNTGAYAVWEQAVEDAHVYVAPQQSCSSTEHVGMQAPSGTSHTVQTSANWAGHKEPHTKVTSALLRGGESTWVQPSVAGNCTYHTYKSAPDASFWMGISTISTKYIIQSGADSIATCTPTYKFWLEDLPRGTLWESTPATTAGDTSYVNFEYNGAGYTTFLMENETTGKYTTVYITTPTPGQTEADFINERLGAYLPDFGTVPVRKNYFWTATTTYGLGGGTYNNIVYMCTTGYKKIISDPSKVTSTNHTFEQRWLPGTSFTCP